MDEVKAVFDCGAILSGGDLYGAAAEKKLENGVLTHPPGRRRHFRDPPPPLRASPTIPALSLGMLCCCLCRSIKPYGL